VRFTDFWPRTSKEISLGGELMAQTPSNVRRCLPDRRASETFELEVDGLQYRATVSRFDDGALGEIFLTNHKTGSAADTAARDSAIVCSMALQFGTDLDTIRKALCRNSQGKAESPLGVALDMLARQQ
jgi:ribonucleoside-diphosphate reductase alpha chain